MTRIPELVKTYKLINDPNAPGWSIRFVGAIAGALLLIAGGAAVYYTATTEIDRRDFGMKHGRLMTGRKLAVVINVQAVRNK